MASTAVSASASGDNTVIAAPGAGKFIRVQAWFLTLNDTGSVHLVWKSGSTALTGAIPIVPSEDTEMGYGATGLFDCLPNQDLILNLDAAKDVEGLVTYVICG